MEDDKASNDWKRFRKLKFDSKKISRRARKAETQTTRHAHKFLLRRLDSLRESRRAILLWLGLVGLILGATTVQAYVYATQATTDAAWRDGTYAEGVVGTLGTLNPLYASSAPEVAVSQLMFSSLYTYDKTGALRPDVASKIAIDTTGKTYTVTLRQDVTWHDGAPLNADDVVFTIETIKNPAARVRSSLQVNWRDVVVKKVDDYTVQFTLPAYAAFPHALTFPIVPKHILATVSPGALYDSSFSRSPVGSGPFVYRLLQAADGVSNQKVLYMTASTTYYGGAPMLGRYELHAYTDEDSLIDAVNASEITSAVDVGAPRLGDIHNSAYQAHDYAINNGVYALMNNATDPFRDKNVRLAVQAAIDTNAIREVAGGDVPALDLPFLRSQVSGADALVAPAYNTTRAEKLLDNAKWRRVGDSAVRSKGKTTLQVRITTTTNSQYQRVAQVIAEQLRAVGFDASVDVIDDKAANANFIQDVLQQRNFDLLVYELPIGADPDVYAYWHSSQTGIDGYNFASYKNAIADATLVSARDRLDTALRDAKYLTFARQWLADAPAIGLYQQTATYVTNKKAVTLDDDTMLVTSSDRYGSVEDWTVSRMRVYKTP